MFAISDGKWAKNIQFRVIIGGEAFSLDSLDYCKSAYEAGRRDYWLNDSRLQLRSFLSVGKGFAVGESDLEFGVFGVEVVCQTV